jgi:hypothetical protein
MKVLNKRSAQQNLSWPVEKSNPQDSGGIGSLKSLGPHLFPLVQLVPTGQIRSSL